MLIVSHTHSVGDTRYKRERKKSQNAGLLTLDQSSSTKKQKNKKVEKSLSSVSDRNRDKMASSD